MWQKRKVAEPVVEGGEGTADTPPSGAFARFRRREQGTSPYGRPVTTPE